MYYINYKTHKDIISKRITKYLLFIFNKKISLFSIYLKFSLNFIQISPRNRHFHVLKRWMKITNPGFQFNCVDKKHIYNVSLTYLYKIEQLKIFHYVFRSSIQFQSDHFGTVQISFPITPF